MQTKSFYFYLQKWYKLMAPVHLSLLQQNLKWNNENLSNNIKGN